MYTLSSCRALVVAGGKGLRFGGCKQFFLIHNKSILWHSVSALHHCKKISDITIVVSQDNKALAIKTASDFNARVVAGAGDSRAQTVSNGLKYFADDEWVLIHDAVRPCITTAAVERLLSNVGEDGALLALPVNDALKQANEMNAIGHIERKDIWMAQTPQVFRVGHLKKALERHSNVADEAEAMTRASFKPQIVLGDKQNIKITYPDDLQIATAFLKP